MIKMILLEVIKLHLNWMTNIANFEFSNVNKAAEG